MLCVDLQDFVHAISVNYYILTFRCLTYIYFPACFQHKGFPNGNNMF